MTVSRSIKIFVPLFSTALCFTAAAQSTAGITNVPDTSYSTASAYRSIHKAYPDATAAPELHSREVKEKKGIVYCTTGERKLVLDAFYPSGKTKQKRIAVMMIHGGGWRSGSRTQHYPLAQHLAALGYVCFTPEYRLSTEALYPAAVHDLKAALHWIHAKAKKYNIDTNKIVVGGFSAGGQLAALIGTTNGNEKFEGSDCNTKYSSRVQAVVDLDGTLSFVHPESGEGDDSKKPSAGTLWFGYSKKENIKVWEEASPLSYVGPNTVPFLFINSGVARMHAGRDDFMKVLKENHIYVDVKTFADAPHHFPLFEPWFTPMVNYIDEFLKTVFPTK
ncbi:alpha/beta hydrolase [Flavisolibacter ginsenosidimutans]|uniref:Alpha/beta hydrolase n=1 Tax=Flavisolibacter ginsenosidimutans TaxID=661481 RepID=A0A5B8UMW4_9BACT|nr:alpha/beta hydrolase [Flavisolibacter ginsenosidimutans]QEC58021.1 alpha/beta hydrolase [Flavisolibacter ginsenosidimutans]